MTLTEKDNWLQRNGGYSFNPEDGLFYWCATFKDTGTILHKIPCDSIEEGINGMYDGIKEGVFRATKT